LIYRQTTSVLLPSGLAHLLPRGCHQYDGSFSCVVIIQRRAPALDPACPCLTCPCLSEPRTARRQAATSTLRPSVYGGIVTSSQLQEARSGIRRRCSHGCRLRISRSAVAAVPAPQASARRVLPCAPSRVAQRRINTRSASADHLSCMVATGSETLQSAAQQHRLFVGYFRPLDVFGPARRGRDCRRLPSNP
jgi:hypothetical protein